MLIVDRNQYLNYRYQLINAHLTSILSELIIYCSWCSFNWIKPGKELNSRAIYISIISLTATILLNCHAHKIYKMTFSWPTL